MKNHLGDQLDSYLDGDLEKTKKADVENHLRSCAECQGKLKILKALSERLSESKPAAVPEGSFKPYWDRLLGRHKEIKTMTAIQRVKRVVESNIHSAIDAMEEPGKMIKQLLREMDAAIEAAREEVVAAVILEKGLAHRHQESAANAKKWDDRATLALKNTREDLAREALKEQMSLEGLTLDLAFEHEKQKARVAELKTALVTLERQWDDLRRRKALWLSQIKNSLEGSGSRRAYQTAYGELGRLLEIKDDRALAESASRELRASETLEETFEAMDRHETLEQRLLVLKQRLQA